MDNYSRVGLGVRTSVSCASHHHHLLLWGHGNLSHRLDHLADYHYHSMKANGCLSEIHCHPIGTDDYFLTIGTIRSNAMDRLDNG